MPSGACGNWPVTARKGTMAAVPYSGKAAVHMEPGTEVAALK